MATAAQTAQAAAILSSYTQVSQRLRAAVLAAVLSAWDSLKSWRDDDIATFVQAAVPVILAGQDHMSALTGAYLNKTIALEAPGSKAIPVLAKSTTGAAVRNGTAPNEVYGRMGPTVWRALQQGDSLDTAVGKARDRLTKVAQSDMQLARTHASKAVLSKAPGIAGYRRVLTGVSSCALCVVASTRKYHKADLLPMHPGCDCTVEPIFGSQPVSQTLDRDALAAAHDEIQQRLGVDTNNAEKLRALTIVHDHGEMGPILAVRDQHFTSEADLNAA